MIGRRAVAAAILLLSSAVPSFGHAVDEYVQAALISLETDHLDVQLRLTPGAEVFSKVFSRIDTDADGVLSDQEKRAYAQRVVRDLSMNLNGHPLTAAVLAVDFPAVDLMKEGLGEIHITLRAQVPVQAPANHLVLENHHERTFAAYLVNCLAPRDPAVRILAQHRNEDQSRYEVTYQVGPGGGSRRQSTPPRSGSPAT